MADQYPYVCSVCGGTLEYEEMEYSKGEGTYQIKIEPCLSCKLKANEEKLKASLPDWMKLWRKNEP